MSNYDSYGSPKRPEHNCRTCTDFKVWSKKQRELFHTSSEKGVKEPHDAEGYDNVNQRTDCPLDRSLLGNYTWGLLHTIAAFYPDKPTISERKDVTTFFNVIARIYPCNECAADFQQDMKVHPVKAGNQKELSLWLCEFHNRVNEKVGKPKFDCSKVNERWRDGWRDGSCGPI